jgi:serine/threonine protein kinase
VKEIEKVSSKLTKGEAKSTRAFVDVDQPTRFSLFRIFRRSDTTSPTEDESVSGKSFRSLASTGSKNQKDERKFSRAHVISRARATRKGKGCAYVIKTVSPDVDKITYMKGNVDIAMEAKYLSSLYHRNIIELAAVSASAPCTKKYFLVLERMETTLTSRLKSWMDRDRMNQSMMACFGGPKRNEQLYVERIEASYDIASALYYLHTKNIVYRDLKTDNIGFDNQNVLKIFDFGLAKELNDEDKQPDGTYRNMTAMTGAIRYMAPEVGTRKPYNHSADVFSWAMLMWFMLALEPPFGLYTDNMIMDRCWVKGYRPVIFKRWSNNMKDTIKNAWDQNPAERPSFLDISLALKQELKNFDVDDSKFAGSSSTSLNSDQ